MTPKAAVAAFTGAEPVFCPFRVSYSTVISMVQRNGHTQFFGASKDRTLAGGFGLPPAILEKARGRLQLFALLMLSMGTLGTVLGYITQLFGEPKDADPLEIYVVEIGSIALAAALYLATRSKRLNHSTVLHIGLAYEVLICLLISIGVQWFIVTKYGHVPHITFVSVLIVLYPMLVPSPPRVTLLTALTAAATAPLGAWLVVRALEFDLPANLLVGTFIFPCVCALIAYFASRVMHGLNVAVVEAQRMGSYMLEEKLGAGGMGEVWKAHHRMLARPAAVKFIKPENLGGYEDGGTASVIQRFENEAKATALQSSPHTVGVYDFGQTDDGRCYYVMELLDGLTLQELIDHHGPQPPERVVHILRQVCHSLDEAHAAGLVHRDIKPANLYLCRYGRDLDFVKVLDFGLVKHSREQSRGPELTRDGVAVGTPSYMAPEMGTAAPPDARTDIYGLGCVAYWLLTGQLVFDASSPVEAIVKHARDTPTPPSQISELDIPAPLDQLVLECLHKAPDDRPQTAGDLSERLGQIPLERLWDKPRMAKWWSAHSP
jgi:serine/threonine-protein kinase